MANLRLRDGSVICAVLALVVTLAGCGHASDTVEEKPSEAVTACRATWRTLNADWEARAESGFPSDLAGRWSALAAGGAYQSAAATEDCQAAIDAAEGDARAIERLSGYLRQYDLLWQFGEVNPSATTWLASAESATGKGAKAQHRAARKVQRALTQLEELAPQAAEDMADAWQAAVQADLADPEAMAELADTITVVASDSVPFQTGSALLARIERLISRR